MDGVVRGNIDGRRRLGIGAAVAALHVAALAWLGVSVVPTLPPVTVPALDIVLLSPGPRPALQPDLRIPGGDAPAAPSTVHAAEAPRPEAVELTAPSEPAPLQPLVLGLSTLTAPAAATGDGGLGSGSGEGTGPGTGEGGGGVVLIQGPAGAVISRDVQSAELVQTDRTHVILRCRILETQQLAGCRVIGEHPRPSGYRRAALLRSREFRFREHGLRPRGGRTVIVALAFPPPEPAGTTAPVDGN